MLATFIIGLREGLEAALIVAIIAAFLRNNGKRLLPMWVGVILAVLLSVIVGVALDVVEKSLPQADQEGMESVIGVIAIVFVTGMIAWMSTHARDMKHQLEAEAAKAIGKTSTYALASMAFLAVLKEGFETSVFLLATLSAMQSAALASVGAVAGLIAAVVIGWGIYIGGIRINLARFFRLTGIFLIFVAAGLVVTSLRTAHEAGWINVGQQTTVNLSWLVAPGSVQSALITGLLGIPADPRRIEVAGWFAYLIPVSLYIFWPVHLRPQPRTAACFKLVLSSVLAISALILFICYPHASPTVPAQAGIVAGNDSTSSIGTLQLEKGSNELPEALFISLNQGGKKRLLLAKGKEQQDEHDGVQATKWAFSTTEIPDHAPANLTLDQLVQLAGRLPVGVSPQRNPGPFTTDWSTHQSITVWISNSILLDAVSKNTTLVHLSDGGLSTRRTLTINSTENDLSIKGWQLSQSYRNHVLAALNHIEDARSKHLFWAIQFPLVLLLIAFLLGISGGRSLNHLRRQSKAGTDNSSTTKQAFISTASIERE